MRCGRNTPFWPAPQAVAHSACPVMSDPAAAADAMFSPVKLIDHFTACSNSLDTIPAHDFLLGCTEVEKLLCEWPHPRLPSLSAVWGCIRFVRVRSCVFRWCGGVRKAGGGAKGAFPLCRSCQVAFALALRPRAPRVPFTRSLLCTRAF